jgi:hypothetical protein
MLKREDLKDMLLCNSSVSISSWGVVYACVPPLCTRVERKKLN